MWVYIYIYVARNGSIEIVSRTSDVRSMQKKIHDCPHEVGYSKCIPSRTDPEIANRLLC